MKNHKNVRQNLLDLLKSFPSLAENYNNLCSHYWAIYDGATTVDTVAKSTPAETITRNFRKLVSNGLVAVPQRVIGARKERSVEFRSEFKNLL
jgi:hypothetical protein